jgi:hypothetical protein
MILLNSEALGQRPPQRDSCGCLPVNVHELRADRFMKKRLEHDGLHGQAPQNAIGRGALREMAHAGVVYLRACRLHHSGPQIHIALMAAKRQPAPA